MSDAVTRLTIEGEGAHLVVVGELDAHSAPTLVDALTPLPDAVDGNGVTLDFSGGTFMDSSGLRVLIESHQRANAEERTLTIGRPAQSVQRLIEISGLGGHLNVAD